MPFRHYWIGRTRQRWKLVAGLAVACIATVCFALGIGEFGNCPGPTGASCASADRGSILVAVAGALGFGSLAWLWLSIRCHACGTRIVWWAMSEKAANAWLASIFALQACPRCGDAGHEGAGAGRS